MPAIGIFVLFFVLLLNESTIKKRRINTMEKSLFEQMGGTYTQAGDYLFPNLILAEEKQNPIGI